MSKIAREVRRLFVQLGHVVRHGTWSPYRRTPRARKPSVLRQRGELEIASALEFVASHLQRPPGQFFFVQIGAFDGQADEPMHSLIRKYGWRGILIEPQREAFERLQATYADQPQLSFQNVAIGPEDGNATLYTLRGGATQIASLDREHLIHHAKSRADIVPQEVPTRTLSSLLRELGNPRVDLLQIDAEGYDAHIIRSLDFTRVRPAIIRYEHSNLLPHDVEGCIELLAEHGYRIMLEDADTLAYRE